jgi:hypothetical protein
MHEKVVAVSNAQPTNDPDRDEALFEMKAMTWGVGAACFFALAYPISNLFYAGQFGPYPAYVGLLYLPHYGLMMLLRRLWFRWAFDPISAQVDATCLASFVTLITMLGPAMFVWYAFDPLAHRLPDGATGTLWHGGRNNSDYTSASPVILFFFTPLVFGLAVMIARACNGIPQIQQSFALTLFTGMIASATFGLAWQLLLYVDATFTP